MVNDMANDGLPCFTGDLIEELSINNDPRHLGDWFKHYVNVSVLIKFSKKTSVFIISSP